MKNGIRNRAGFGNLFRASGRLGGSILPGPGPMHPAHHASAQTLEPPDTFTNIGTTRQRLALKLVWAAVSQIAH